MLKTKLQTVWLYDVPLEIANSLGFFVQYFTNSEQPSTDPPDKERHFYKRKKLLN